LYVAPERHSVFTLRRTPRGTQHRIGNGASMNPPVSWVACGGRRARSVLRGADVLGRLPTGHAGGAYLTAGNGANGKHSDDHNDDNQHPAGNPPADWRLLVLEILIVRVRAAVAGIVRRLAVHRLTGLGPVTVLLTTLAVRGLSGLPVLLLSLRSCSGANQPLGWRRRGRIGGGCRRPSLAIPVPEESLAPTRIGVPSSLRTHGPSLCCEGPEARSAKPVVIQHTVKAKTAGASSLTEPPGDVILGRLLVWI
jgi:hypothetical protein